MAAEAIFGSHDLRRVLNDLRMSCLDIGARHGFSNDLLPIASAVDAIGFEPDREECDRLNAAAAENSHPWRSLRYIPAALGKTDAMATLNLYSQRGCSSLLEADNELARLFSRDDYYRLEDRIELSLSPLDEAAEAGGFDDAVYLKIDVQGYEMEVFAGAEKLLTNSLQAIRTEVSFLPIYKQQPLFHDVARHLEAFGFSPMGFEEMHSWRRSTKVKHPRLAATDIPYSRGQLIHGDVLFLRHPEHLPDKREDQILRLISLAFIALTYGYVDHASAILRRPAVQKYLDTTYQLDVDDCIRRASCHLHHAYRRRLRKEYLASWIGSLSAFVKVGF